jgi:phosphatidylinositol-3-phosphatase
MRPRLVAVAICIAAVALGVAAMFSAVRGPTPARAATDTEPPTMPGGIHNAGNVADPQTQIRVAWTASTDNVGVTGYDVARNGVHVDTRPATGLDHASSGLTCGTSYTFAVRAKDAAGNFSPAATLTTSTAACSQPAPTTGACGGLTGAPHITKAVWIWFENHAFTSITPTAAPYFNQIKRECGYASNYHSVTNFVSLPEYLASTGGSNHGVTDDAGPASHQLNFNNVFRQIDQAGKSWRSYQQGMTSNCMKTSTGRYAPKHNPAAYYVGTNGATSCATSDVPLPAAPSFASDFTIVEPDLCNSMHDCSVATGDAWLKTILPKVIASSDYQAGNTAVFVTFDEGAGGNETLFTLVLSRFTTPGTVSGAAFNHYALLHTTQDILDLPCLLNSCTAPDMRSAFGLM